MALPYKLSDALWLALYVAVMAAVVGGLFYARHRALVIYGTDRAQVEWDAWREDAKEIAKGPVIRRAPKSAEPPALVLMRDYFEVCVAISVALSSVLFGTLVFLVRGALGNSSKFVDRSPPERHS